MLDLDRSLSYNRYSKGFRSRLDTWIYLYFNKVSFYRVFLQTRDLETSENQPAEKLLHLPNLLVQIDHLILWAAHGRLQVAMGILIHQWRTDRFDQIKMSLIFVGIQGQSWFSIWLVTRNIRSGNSLSVRQKKIFTTRLLENAMTGFPVCYFELIGCQW